MKLQKLTSDESSGLLITWSRSAVATALVWFEYVFKIGLTFLVMRVLRWLITGHS